MAKGNLDQFITYLTSQLGSLYVWGAQGEQMESIVRKWVRSMETSDSNADRVISLYNAKNKGIAAYDCSGLGVCWLLKNNVITSDMTADGMYRKCTKITKSALRRGDWVFVLNGNGTATHIGYVVDDKGTVIHAKGRDYGVVSEPFAKHNWNAHGRPDFAFDFTATNITQTLKSGLSGSEVAAVQARLSALGYKPGRIDGVYGEQTAEAVKSFQDDQGIPVNGRVGKETSGMLGFTWAG